MGVGGGRVCKKGNSHRGQGTSPRAFTEITVKPGTAARQLYHV